MTKHTAGKYGRTIGMKERKAGWPSPATAWCYMCNDSHRWEEACGMRAAAPTTGQRQSQRERQRVA